MEGCAGTRGGGGGGGGEVSLGMRQPSFITVLSLALQEAPRRRVSRSDYGRHRDVSSGT